MSYLDCAQYDCCHNKAGCCCLDGINVRHTGPGDAVCGSYRNSGGCGNVATDNGCRFFKVVSAFLLRNTAHCCIIRRYSRCCPPFCGAGRRMGGPSGADSCKDRLF